MTNNQSPLGIMDICNQKSNPLSFRDLVSLVSPGVIFIGIGALLFLVHININLPQKQNDIIPGVISGSSFLCITLGLVLLWILLLARFHVAIGFVTIIASISIFICFFLIETTSSFWTNLSGLVSVLSFILACLLTAFLTAAQKNIISLK